MDHKFTLEANEFQAGLDKPHEHVVDLKAESEIQDVIKKMSLGPKAWNTSGRREAGKTTDYCECLCAPPSFPLKGHRPQAPLGPLWVGREAAAAVGHLQDT